MPENIHYIKEGKAGLQCKDCQFFIANSKDDSQGKCFGDKVEAKGSCNRFIKKFIF